MPIEKVETLDGLPSDLVESRHAARIAQASLQSLYRWILNGRLRGWRRCGRTFVSRADLLALFEKMPTQSEKPVNDIPTRRDVNKMKRWTENELKKRGVIPS